MQPRDDRRRRFEAHQAAGDDRADEEQDGHQASDQLDRTQGCRPIRLDRDDNEKHDRRHRDQLVDREDDPTVRLPRIAQPVAGTEDDGEE